MTMKVSELIEILSNLDQEATIVCHDGEYDDYWQIENVYPVNDGLIKISPFADGHLWDGRLTKDKDDDNRGS